MLPARRGVAGGEVAPVAKSFCPSRATNHTPFCLQRARKDSHSFDTSLNCVYGLPR